MPRIPSVQDINRQTPSFERQVVALPEDPTGKIMQQTGNQLQQTGNQLERQAYKISQQEERQLAEETAKINRLQKATAQTNTVLELNELRTSFVDDPDYATQPKRFNDAANKITAKYAATINDPNEQQFFQLGMSQDISNYKLRMTEDATQKRNNQLAVSYGESNERIRNQLVATTDPAEQQALIRADRQLNQSLLEAGVITPAQASQGKTGIESTFAISIINGKSPQERLKILDGKTNNQAGGFDNAINIVLENEGGYNPNDGNSGAPANFGINQMANPDVDVANLKVEQAKQLYKERYWDKYDLQLVPDDTQAIVFDGVVNHRSDFAKELVDIAKKGATVEDIKNMRNEEYMRLASLNPEKYQQFLGGWQKRIAKFDNEDTKILQYITPLQQNEIRNQTENEINVEKKQLNYYIKNINNNTKNGYPANTEDMQNGRALAEKIGDTEAMAFFDQSLQINQAASQMNTLTLPQQTQAVNLMKSATVLDGASKEEKLLFEASDAKLQANIKLAKDDAVSMAELQGYQFAQPDQDKFLEKNAITMETFAETNGLPTHNLLKENQRENLYQDIVKSENPKDMLGQIAFLSKSSGKYFPDYMDEINKHKNTNLSNVIMRVGEMMEHVPNSVQISSDALAGAKMLEINGDGIIPEGRQKALQVFNEHVGRTLDMVTPSARKRLFETALALNVRTNPKNSTDKLNVENFKANVNQIFTGSTEEENTMAIINNERFILPVKMNAATAMSYWNNLSIDDFEKTGLPTNYNNRTISVNEIIDDAELIFIGDNKYNLYYKDGMLQDMNGEDFVFSFGDKPAPINKSLISNVGENINRFPVGL